MTYARWFGGRTLVAVLAAGWLGCTGARRPDEAADRQPPAPAIPRAAEQVALPRAATRGLLPEASTDVVLAPDAIMVNDQFLATINAGQIDDTHHHRIDPLFELLVNDQTRPPVVVHADRSLPYGAVIDALYTSSRAGRSQLAVAVADGPTIGVVAVAAPASWDPDDDRQRDASCFTRIVVDRATLRLRPCHGGEQTEPLTDTPAIAAIGDQRDTWGSHDLHLAATPTTHWATIVTILDLLLAPAAAPGDRPWTLVLDLDPPLPFRPGDWDALTVSLADIEHNEHARRKRSDARLRRRARAALPAIERCLRGSAEMRLRVPARLSIMIATDARGRDVSFASGPRNIPPCVGEAIAPLAARPVLLAPGDAWIDLEITVPPAAP